MATIDITGKDKALVLAALFNRARPLGLGFIHYKPRDMDIDEARRVVQGMSKADSGQVSFDYLEGRVMKVNLTGDSLETWGYDRDNGNGAAERALRDAGVI